MGAHLRRTIAAVVTVPVNGTGTRIASLGYGGNQEVQFRQQAADNAAFIVTACNQHADLVARNTQIEKALADIYDTLEGYVDGAPDASPVSKAANHVIALIDSAMARAKEIKP